MAVTVTLFDYDGQLGIDLYLDQIRERVRDDPPGSFSPVSPWIFEWDAEALDERDEHEFLSLFTPSLADLSDDDIDELDRLPLPQVDYPPAGLRDVRISDLIRWARRHQPGGRVKPRSA